MIRKLPQIFLFLLSCYSISAQQKIYFDRNGVKTSDASAYYYRYEIKPGQLCKSYYASNDAPYFEGIILSGDDLNESRNKYKGTCTWYYKNGNKRAVLNFDDEGLKSGNCIYYYEDGKIQSDADYKKGQIAGSWFREYTESGKGYRVFREEFNNNSNDWELYNSDRSTAGISDSKLQLASKLKYGTSRYINVPTDDTYLIECEIKAEESKDNGKAGIIYEFKDWQNHYFFLINRTYFTLGSVIDGATKYLVEGMYSQALNEKDFNTLRILNHDGEVEFTINGELVFKAEDQPRLGSSIGFAVGGRSKMSVEKLEVRVPLEKEARSSAEDKGVKSSGSGVLLSRSGYIVTNNHVISEAGKVLAELNANGVSKTYEAKVIAKDAANDLAIIKIIDTSFHAAGNIDYKFKSGGTPDIGSYAFTIGYPLALSGMGKEPKFSDGRISSKTGYNNEVNTFQTTIPVQPGNSGSPVFNEQGELIGIINSKVMNADNVSYAVKLSYLSALMDNISDSGVDVGKGEDISQLKLEEKIKRLLNMVVLIKIKQ
jgi:S1-C subfamily serine protease